MRTSTHTNTWLSWQGRVPLPVRRLLLRAGTVAGLTLLVPISLAAAANADISSQNISSQHTSTQNTGAQNTSAQIIATQDIGTVTVTTATLSQTDDSRLIFPVVLSAVSSSPIIPTLVSVSRNGAQSATEAAAFTPKWDPAIPALVLNVKIASVAAQGAYTVAVKLAAGTASQLVTLTVTRPVASLVAPAHVPVVITRPWWKFSGANSTPKLLVVPGQDDKLTLLTGQQTDAAAGSITITPVGPIGPDGKEVLYQLNDSFELGITSRTVQLKSPQLGAPVTVVFDVTTRRPESLIAAIVGGGLFLGGLSRIVLVRLLAWLHAKQRALDLRETISGLESGTKDATLKNTLVNLRAELSSVRGSAAARNTNIDTIQQQLTTAQDGLDARIAKAQSDYATLTNLDRPFDLPPQLLDKLAGLRSALAGAREHLAAADADGAATDLTTAHQRADDLKTGAADHLADLTRAFGSIDPDATGRIAGSIRELDWKAGQITDHATVPKDADPVVSLRAIEAARSVFPTFQKAASAFGLEAGRVADILTTAGQNGQAPPSAGPELQSDVTAFSALVDPADIARAVPDLLAAIGTAIDSVSNAPGVADSKKAGDFVGAARAATQPVLEGITPPTVPLIPSQLTAPVISDGAAIAGLVPPTPFQIRAAAAPARAIAWTAIIFVQFAQLVILSIALVLSAYVLFGPDWIGDAKGIFTVFTWAFAIDLTVGGVTTVITSVANQKPSTGV